ncbi:hypothetical protein Poli38472_002597 [Pythium oligandrum]|uniref:Uncharacterized protein n=1 Tax=Pythium oligandrum TaxID=41045 RepID=A0A8K1CJ25_PYTOL|nr:hypothetical protein Poli38472_002597 [Pythium oligandrum]|eukprot:TMW63656.1 hypothetical protein Poli38472_002597 [Pythium oligandrum]
MTDAWARLATFSGLTGPKGYSVLGQDDGKLSQPLIGGLDDSSDEESPHDVEYGSKRQWYDETEYAAPQKKTVEDTLRAVLQALLPSVLWPSQAPTETKDARISELKRASPATLTTPLRASVRSRRKAETMEDIHERALLKIAALTLALSTWLIIAVYMHSS